MQTGCHGAYVGRRLKRLRPPGRRHWKCQPSSRTGENPPYGMIGGIEETSASFEARSAPRSYPTLRSDDALRTLADPVGPCGDEFGEGPSFRRRPASDRLAKTRHKEGVAKVKGSCWP